MYFFAFVSILMHIYDVLGKNIWRQISELGSPPVIPEFDNLEKLFCQQEKKAKDVTDGKKKKKESAEVVNNIHHTNIERSWVQWH